MECVRIVVGVDGSEAAREAVRWSVGFGRTFGAEIVAVTPEHAPLEDVYLMLLDDSGKDTRP